ncbi:hypothetical protein A3Q56_06707 [Intoshia linei]|uniref:Uncharacterized protein n=1 Tax=Intoshia linei TaxID=1819745 RepID=A0A177AVM1_9BILA|nr:hypothetical protein A3Q56_06707 [Intoshia linei]
MAIREKYKKSTVEMRTLILDTYDNNGDCKAISTVSRINHRTARDWI